MFFQNKSSFFQAGESYPNTPAVIRLVLKYSGGMIKNRRQAEMVIFGFVIIAILFSLLMFIVGSSKNTKAPPLSPKIENAGSPREIINP